MLKRMSIPLLQELCRVSKSLTIRVSPASRAHSCRMSNCLPRGSIIHSKLDRKMVKAWSNYGIGCAKAFRRWLPTRLTGKLTWPSKVDLALRPQHCGLHKHCEATEGQGRWSIFRERRYHRSDPLSAQTEWDRDRGKHLRCFARKG